MKLFLVIVQIRKQLYTLYGVCHKSRKYSNY